MTAFFRCPFGNLSVLVLSALELLTTVQYPNKRRQLCLYKLGSLSLFLRDPNSVICRMYNLYAPAAITAKTIWRMATLDTYFLNYAFFRT